MKMPDLLPEELKVYGVADSDEGLFQMLFRRGDDLIPFLVAACDDETWAFDHRAFMQMVFAQLTDFAYKDNLPYGFAEQVADAVYPHYINLAELFPRNITCQIGGKSLQVNGLLMGAASRYVHDRLIRECRDQNTVEWDVEEIPYAIMELFVEFFHTGTIFALWRHGRDQLHACIDYARRWELVGLVKLCEETLIRYITPENVLETLVEAHRKDLLIVKEAAMELTNEQLWGIRFDPTVPESLALEFFDFGILAMKAFEKVREEVTHLICTLNVAEEQAFTDVVQSCPRLIGLDISRTVYDNSRLDAVPKNLKHLNLSQCSWMTDQRLNELIEMFPKLTQLVLDYNLSISYMGWGNLRKLPRLEALSIAHCHQIKDRDLLVILRALHPVTRLNMEDCQNVSDRTLFDLGANAPRLEEVVLARTQVGDASLIELATQCKELRVLDVSHCPNISDVGVLETVAQTRHLERLDVSRSPISQAVLTKIKQRYPVTDNRGRD